ncbi:MAG: MBL fold metallo-hydrolase [Spirochaetes bacterium]|nr:MBL fold metallo-hydrolase [Spirochaetota bacterium]
MKLSYKISNINNTIYRISLPLPGYPPYINVYLFKGEVNTLFDTGIYWTWRLLRNALKELGLQFSDIHQIIPSHGHVDHYGAAYAIVNKNKYAAVIAHNADSKRIEEGIYAKPLDMLRFITAMGVPTPLIVPLAFLDVIFKSMGHTVTVTKKIVGDEFSILVGNYNAKLLLTPGHSKGAMCLYIEKEGFLFSGDHIVPGVKPIILAGFEPNTSFPVWQSHTIFHNSLKKIEKLNPKYIFPAHGEPFQEKLSRLISKYLKVYQFRRKRMFNLLLNNDYTVYSLARNVFKNLKGVNLVLDLYLSLSETYTHLEAMCNEGEVIRYKFDKVYYYTASLL